MSSVLVGFAEFVLVLGGIGILLTVLFCLGLGLAAKAITQMFSGKPAHKRQVGHKAFKQASEVELLRRQLFEARNTAYESALASEKAIQQMQQRLAALESERLPDFVPVRRC